MQRESFKLDGASALDAQLAALGEKIATKIGRDAVEASAEALSAAWKAGAPFDPKQRGSAKRYGHLRANIKIGPVKARNVHAVVWKVSTGDAFWALWLEYGNARQAPRPWARPINERMKGALVEIQIETLNAGIAGALASGKKG